MRTVVAFVLIWSVCAIASSGGATCNEKEKQALLAFKQALSSDPSGALSSWSLHVHGSDCCNWRGIRCNNVTGRVIELHLSNLNLSGNLTPSLLDLKFLNYLNLSSNNFGGSPIPSFLGSMTSLVYLDLESNDFEGLIRHQLRNLSNIRYLNLGHNDGLYTDNLNWIDHLRALEFLDMTGVNLSREVNWLRVVSSLPSLSELYLSDCLLENMSPLLEHVNFTSLTVLDLSINNFNCEISKWLFNLNNSLRSLVLSNNFLHDFIPYEIGQLKHLRELDLAMNNLNGSIPESLGNLSFLEKLLLYHNQLNGPIPESLGNLSSLVQLHLWDNQLNGQIPESLGNLSSLVQLDLWGNQLNGPIPKSLGNLLFLKKLYLDNNQLNGLILESLGNLSFLEILDLSNNQLNGPMPESLGNLSSLEILDLSDNQLNGPMPESLGNLLSLNQLFFENNQLNGTIPKSIWVLSKLNSLDISNNNLEGIVTEADLSKLSKLRFLHLFSNSFSFNISSIWVPSFQLDFLSVSSCKMGPHFPSWLKTQTSLSYIDISKTGISDTIPHWFWDWTLHTNYISLSQNQIDGDLSSVILNSSFIDISSNRFRGKLPNLSSNVHVLNVANNNFSGPIETFLCQKENKQNTLEVLDASYNLLSGKLSDCWTNWRSLMHINLGNNNLSGEIPISMGSLSNLESLQLHDNKLIGYIPSSLKNCQSLSLINLGGNELNGTIPSWLGHITNLLILRLNSNKFVGNIPLHICHLSCLIVLDLGNNNLVGSIPKCLSKITEMVHTNGSYLGTLIYYDYAQYRPDYNGSYVKALNYYDYAQYRPDYKEILSLVTKGRESKYKEILSLVRSIDLSNNSFSGSIPSEISILAELHFLNLSHNQLVGKLPEKLGNMKMLESFDVSRNYLSGKIPQSISTLTYLSDLNLSFNNLFGRIPMSTQLQSLNESAFMGNPRLCGPPLKINCTVQQNYPETRFAVRKDVKEFEMFWFHITMILGFIIGFWGVCGTLLLKRTWRHAYFQSIDDMKNHIYVITILIMNWMHKKFQR